MHVMCIYIVKGYVLYPVIFCVVCVVSSVVAVGRSVGGRLDGRDAKSRKRRSTRASRRVSHPRRVDLLRDDVRDGAFLEEDFLAGFLAPAARFVFFPPPSALGNLSGTTKSSPRWKRIATTACATKSNGNAFCTRPLNAKQFIANAPCAIANHFSPTRVVRSLSLSTLANPLTANRDPNSDTMNAPALDRTVCITVPLNGPESIIGTNAKTAERGCAMAKISNPSAHCSALRCNASVLARTMSVGALRAVSYTRTIECFPRVVPSSRRVTTHDVRQCIATRAIRTINSTHSFPLPRRWAVHGWNDGLGAIGRDSSTRRARGRSRRPIGRHKKKVPLHRRVGGRGEDATTTV